MKSVYYDTNYLIKLQCAENGAAEVVNHSNSIDRICSSLHGRAEFATATHRKFREGAASRADIDVMLCQIKHDSNKGLICWFPITEKIIEKIESVVRTAPANTFIRGADALHLASAAEHGFTEIYSNDKHLLNAAPLFGLQGMNVIPQTNLPLKNETLHPRSHSFRQTRPYAR